MSTGPRRLMTSEEHVLVDWWRSRVPGLAGRHSTAHWCVSSTLSTQHQHKPITDLHVPPSPPPRNLYSFLSSFPSTPSLIHLEPDCIVRKPMKHRFQWYIVRTETLSIFHTRVEYISRQTIQTGLSAYRQTDRQTDRQTTVKIVYPPVSLRSLGGYSNE